MKKMFIIALSLLMVACDGDETTVINNNDRVADLERRADLQDQINLAQAQVNEDQAEALAGAILAQSLVNQDLQDQIDGVNQDLQATKIAQLLVNLLTNLRINALQSGLNTLNGKLVALTTRVSTAESDINALEADVADIKNDILALEARDGDLQSQITGLGLSVNTLQGDLSSLESVVSTLNSRVFGLEISQVIQNAYLLVLTGRINQLKNRVDSLEDDFNDELADLQSQIDDLQDQVDSLPTEAEVEDMIEDAVAGLQDQIDDLEDQIEDLEDQGGSGPTPTASCSVTKTNQYSNESHYSFTVTNLSSYTGYELEVNFQASVSNVGNNNGGDSDLSTNKKKYELEPQNGASSVMLYVYKNGANAINVTSAKVTKGSQTINCLVAN